MEQNILLFLFGLFMLVAFITGFKCGCKRDNKVMRKEPNISPVKVAKKEIRKENELREKQLELEKIMLENIDAYDGTGLGQQDLPK